MSNSPRVVTISKRRFAAVFMALLALCGVVGFNVTTASQAHADGYTANVCMAVKGNTNWQGSYDEQAIGVQFDANATGTPMPYSLIKYLHDGQCSKSLYPGFHMKYFYMPYKAICYSQWGGTYVSGKFYYPTAINGTITFTCKNSTSGV